MGTFEQERDAKIKISQDLYNSAQELYRKNSDVIPPEKSPQGNISYVRVSVSKDEAELHFPQQWDEISPPKEPKELRHSNSVIQIYYEGRNPYEIIGVLALLWTRGNISGTNTRNFLNELNNINDPLSESETELVSALPPLVCLNSFELDEQSAREIRLFCHKNGIPFALNQEIYEIQTIEAEFCVGRNTPENLHLPQIDVSIQRETSGGHSIKITNPKLEDFFFSDKALEGLGIEYCPAFLVYKQRNTLRWQHPSYKGAFNEDTLIHQLRCRFLIEEFKQNPLVVFLLSSGLIDEILLDSLGLQHDLGESGLGPGDIPISHHNQAELKEQWGAAEEAFYHLLETNGLLPKGALTRFLIFDDKKLTREDARLEGILARLADGISGNVFFEKWCLWEGPQGEILALNGTHATIRFFEPRFNLSFLEKIPIINEANYRAREILEYIRVEPTIYPFLLSISEGQSPTPLFFSLLISYYYAELANSNGEEQIDFCRDILFSLDTIIDTFRRFKEIMGETRYSDFLKTGLVDLDMPQMLIDEIKPRIKKIIVPFEQLCIELNGKVDKTLVLEFVELIQELLILEIGPSAKYILPMHVILAIELDDIIERCFSEEPSAQ